MESKSSALETVLGLLAVAALGTQTWLIVQDATDGQAGRAVCAWWGTTGRPAVVRVVTWLDARAITDRMVTEEIGPLLEEDRSDP